MRRKIDSFSVAVIVFAILFCLVLASRSEAQSEGKENPVPSTTGQEIKQQAPTSAKTEPEPQTKNPLPAKAAVQPAPAVVYKDPVTGMELVQIKMGCFAMGDAAGDGTPEEKPVHKVCIDLFYMGRYEVTVGQFRKFVEETGYKTEAEKNLGVTGCWAYDQADKENRWAWRSWANWRTLNKYQKSSDDVPVSCVSWKDATEFAKWLSKKSGKMFDLPSEAEWEYAARGGTKTRNYWGDGKDDACAYANVADLTPLPGRRIWGQRHECSDGYSFVAPVGQFQPNAFGLYDMIGNVCEWVGDWYDNVDKGFYANSPLNNPLGAGMGTDRVLRGGSWMDDPPYARSALRGHNKPEFRSSYLGFRLMMKP